MTFVQFILYLNIYGDDVLRSSSSGCWSAYVMEPHLAMRGHITSCMAGSASHTNGVPFLRQTLEEERIG